ncbi:unnamed protein product [Somion occarium]|uniref:N-acetyltransferase domain-containing protein n=1 Tax=Somion occarium TaxID=3059160 RepID=A0ABP1DWI2_9APHY
MSAYGAINTGRKSKDPLPSTIWHTKTKGSQAVVPQSSLVFYLHESFAEELERGRTYPQEILQGELYAQNAFEAYFFAADVLVAVIGQDVTVPEGKTDGSTIIKTIEEARGGRAWKDCIAGAYYVKPNYPGRSSHICNAGFLVPASQRSRGFGAVLARSYLYYGPRLGFEASVFNLVYVNNVASVKLWDALNFSKVGRIPRAGRLRTADGMGEEYVDAWVIYKQFDKAVDGTN